MKIKKPLPSGGAKPGPAAPATGGATISDRFKLEPVATEKKSGGGTIGKTSAIIGLVGGVLNGACYVGSTLSQYGIAVIATMSDWNTVMRVLAYLCLVSSVVALIVKIKRKVQG